MPRLVSSRALLLLVDRPTGPGPVVLGNVRLSLGQEVEQEKQRTGAESLLAEEGLSVTGPSPQEGRGSLCPGLVWRCWAGYSSASGLASNSEALGGPRAASPKSDFGF